MLRSQFFALLAKKTVMINFLLKLALVCAKNANIFTKFFGENIFKTLTSVPDVLRKNHPILSKNHPKWSLT
jgi:hypothetical protein